MGNKNVSNQTPYMNSFTQEPEEIEKFLDFFEEDLENIRRTVKFCRKEELEVKFEVHPKAETVDESVQHSSLEKEQIIKTLIFRTGETFIAVLTPGNKRVDEDRLKEITGEEDVRMAKLDEVEEETGYVVGGVSPFDLGIEAFMEEELLQHDEVRPAAGSRILGAQISPGELREAVGAEPVKIVE